MKALIFDMDGLMVDTERLYFEAERQMVKDFNKELKDETLWKMMGRSPLEAMKVLTTDLNLDIAPEELLKMRDNIMIQKYKNDLIVMPGLFEIINKFHNKLLLAIATGATKIFLDIVLDKLKIRDCFTVLQSSDNIKKGKPDPEIYLATLSRLNVNPYESIVLEDSSNGARAAKNAGCYTIAVISQYTQFQDFSFVDYKTDSLISASVHIENMLEGALKC
jgi:beta-phosphoglucomutase-like phosphatase (HAD superfamily)